METRVQASVQMRDVWTFDDLQSLDVPDWWRYEIVDGGLVVTPSAAPLHELAAEEVRAAVRAGLASDLVVIGPVAVELGTSYLIPDLVVTRRSGLRGRAMLLPEDVLLAVEIVSPGSVSMDRIVKPAKYAAAGIAHYWRVETDPVSLVAYALPSGESAYTEVGAWVESDGPVRLSQPFPVELDLGRLLGE